MTGSSQEFYGTGTNFLRYRYRYFFLGPIFSGIGTFFGTNFFRYRYWYFFRDQIFRYQYLNFFWFHPKNGKFPGILWYRYQIPGNSPVPIPIFSGTDTSTFFRDQIFPVPVLFFRNQCFPVPVPRHFSGINFFTVPVPSQKEQNSLCTKMYKGTPPRRKIDFFRALPKLPLPPPFGQVVQLFLDVKNDF